MRVLCVFGRYAYGEVERGEAYEYANFLPALENISTEVSLFDSFSRDMYADFAELNLAFLETVDRFKPDLVFAVLMGYEIWTETLEILRQRTSTAFLNWGTDDSWKFDQFTKYISPYLDCHATTYRAAKKRAEQLALSNVVQSQWAASSRTLAEPLSSDQCEFDVSFVGTAYGNRRHWVEALKARDINVTCFGHGWGRTLEKSSDVLDIYRRSKISLNFADSGVQLSKRGLRRNRQIKARTFEVPGAGGLLLTEPAEDLDLYFKLGEEIDTFAEIDQLADKIGFYLSRPDLRDQVAWNGQKRVCADHTYEQRFRPLIDAALRARRERGVQHWSLRPQADLAPFIETYAAGAKAKVLRYALLKIGSLLYGRERGARAARRAVYEAYWRFRGARTYSSAGLPGQLFYKES